jgi:predicted ABC-type ATPase/predicted GNAT family acetyltransferase
MVSIGTPSQYSPAKLIGLNSPESLGKGEYFAVVKDGKTTIGSLWVKKYKDDYILRDVFVRPDVRRQGVATKLVQAVLEHLAPKKAPIFVYVNSDNKPARDAYIKLGFRLVKKGAFQGDKYAYTSSLPDGVLVCGPPGTGKSSNLLKLLRDIGANVDKVVDPDKLAGTHEEQSKKAMETLKYTIETGEPVVYVAACHGLRTIRAILGRMKDLKYTTKVVIVYTTIPTALKRIAGRTTQPLDPDIAKEVHEFFATKAEAYLTMPDIDELYLYNNETDLTLLLTQKEKTVTCYLPNGEFYFDISKYC